MKKKLGLILIIFLIAPVLAVVVPWDKVNDLKNSILGVEESLASLKVYSLAGSIKVFVDDKERGVVSSDMSYLEVFPLSVGEHEVSLQRQSTSGEFYKTFEEKIWLEKGFDTVISYEIGPSKQASSGWILYAKKDLREDELSSLHFNCELSNCKLKLGDTQMLDSGEVYDLSLNNQLQLKAFSEGYQDLDFSILPEDSDERQKLSGYDLYLDVNLYQIPI